ncbi:hypothetical protein EsHS_00006417 [Epichloe bromicola]
MRKDGLTANSPKGSSSEQKPRQRKRGGWFGNLTYCCVSYFMNFLDRAAFANAYVSGLREALGMTGHEYNNVLSITTAGMAVGQLPHGIIIQRMVSAAAKNTTQLYVIRFLLGLAEASTYSGTIYIIGAWYRPDEISKRTAIFSGFGQIGTMFAGIMMTAIYKGMSGLAGLEGWQWVFLIDGLITLPIAVFGYLFFPDIPENTQAVYLSEKEKHLAVARLPPVQENGHNISPMSLIKRVALTPVFWILFFWSPVCATIEGFPFQNSFLLWLKYNSKTFTQTQINTYPLGVQAVGIVATILTACYMDVTGRRAPMAVLACSIQIVVGTILLVKDIPPGLTFFVFYLAGSAYMVQPLIFGWANIILQRSGDDAVRSVTLYSMNIGSMVLWTFWGIVFFSAADAPYWKKGGIATIVCAAVMFGYTWLVRMIDHQTRAKYADKLHGLDLDGRQQSGHDSEKAVVTGS